MFAKMINENQIEQAPRCIHVGATTFVMPNAEQYAAGGYYEVVEGEPLEPRKWYHIIAKYSLQDEGEGSYSIKRTEQVLKEGTEDEYEEITTEDTYTVQMKKIVKTYEYEKDERPDYGELIVGYIREVYSLNDELALQRQWDNSPAKKQEFNEYNNFCDDCKIKAKADLAEYDAA